VSDPFRISEPTCISFSGGRTSAYMLWRVLQSNAGLPADAVVCFANTGKEEEATLRFVRDCSQRWSVPMTWLEYRDDGYAVVDYVSASRAGEPFEALIRKRQYLPNPVTRFCTVELKIRAMHKHLQALGWTEWSQMVGIRADEQRRVAKIRGRAETNETMLMPLADAGVTLADVQLFWAAQPFGLELAAINGRTQAGNCDLCFLKAANQVRSLIAQRPARALWWARMEALPLTSKAGGGRFRSDRPSYAAMLQNVSDQSDAFGHDEEAIACYCGE
jgi:3'-phosphoadenosine 5'-phosphosulfate sulfotransferase (PAPS reductase)/FAD synthetase